jgi:hypothetical protein
VGAPQAPVPASDEAGHATGAQNQFVEVTASSGTGLTLALPVYLDDLSSANTPGILWVGPTLDGQGLEDMTIDLSATDTGVIFMYGCYECWVKGVREIGNSNTGGNSGTSPITIDASANFLIANNYFFGYNSGSYGIVTGVSYGASYGLVINNITDHILGAAAEDISTSGMVVAYNYSQFPSNESYFLHMGGTTYNMFEGNDNYNITVDGFHGVHDFVTAFRNRTRGTPGSSVFSGTSGFSPVTVMGGSRFNNFVGNVLGDGTQASYSAIYGLGLTAMTGGLNGTADPLVAATTMRWGNYDTFNAASRFVSSEVPSTLTTWNGYQQNIATGDGTTTAFSGTLTNCSVADPCVNIVLGDMKDGYFSYDNNGNGHFFSSGFYNGGTTTPLVSPYGAINYTTGAVSATYTTAPSSGATIFVNYLQPTATASPYQNAVPANNNLPPSFFMPTTAHPAGGTGLSWWKVCTNYPTCSASAIPPFPAIGPDVSAGEGVNVTVDSLTGHAYPIPAEIAYNDLPIDTSYEKTVSVSAASWSAGVATITLSSVPPLANQGEYHYLAGRFVLSGVSPSGYNGTYNVSSSNCSATCTVTYALTSNPGTYSSGGSFVFPTIPQFNETVYQSDSGTPQAGTPVPTPGAGSYGGPVSVTLSNPSSAPVICYNTTGSPATNGTTGCTTGSVYSTAISVPSSETLYFVAGGTGFIDSAVGSAAYVIGSAVSAPAPAMFAARRETHGAGN